jgi:gluconokinase
MYWTWRAPGLAAERGLGAGAGTGAASSRFLGLSEYVGLVLLGDPTMSVSMASGTGLFATAALGWDEEALNIAGVTAAALPPVAPPDWQGRLAPDWSRRWPALAGARWHASLGDGAAANLGVGCSSPARAAVTVGTSAAVRTVRAAPDPSVLQGGLWRYCVDHERVVLGAAYSSGGQLYTWALSLWEGSQEGSQGPDRPHAGRADDGPADDVRYGTSMPVAAGSEGVLVLPWHVGTRPPAAAVPARQGIVVGLGLEHNGAHIVSASAEAVCFQLAGGLADLEADREAGFARPLEVVANGGAIERSPWWQQRLAAALGRTLLCSAVPETTARGAAAHALGVDLSADQVDGVVVEPHPEEVTALAEARHRWLEWYDKLLPIVS